jgi:hypothetical protein
VNPAVPLAVVGGGAVLNSAASFVHYPIIRADDTPCKEVA